MLSIEQKWAEIVGFHLINETLVRRMRVARRCDLVPGSRITQLHNDVEAVKSSKMKPQRLNWLIGAWLGDLKAVLDLAERIAFLESNVFLVADHSDESATALGEWATQRTRSAYERGTLDKRQLLRIKDRIEQLSAHIAAGTEWRSTAAALGRLLAQASAHVRVVVNPTDRDRELYENPRTELAERVRLCRVHLGMEPPNAEEAAEIAECERRQANWSAQLDAKLKGPQPASVKGTEQQASMQATEPVVEHKHAPAIAMKRGRKLNLGADK